VKECDGTWPSLTEISKLPRRRQAEKYLTAVSVRYPQQELSPDTVAAYKADFEKLIRDHGLMAFSSALYHATKSTSFFPVLADIVKHIPSQQIRDFSPLTTEDRARIARGEGFGQGEVLGLWKMFTELRRKIGRPLTKAESEALIDEVHERAAKIRAQA
jgi:hypothetical protein